MKYLFPLCVFCCLLSWCTWEVIVDDSVDVSTGDIIMTGAILSGDVMTGDASVSGSTVSSWLIVGESDTPVVWVETKTYAWIMKIYPKDGTYYVDLDYVTAMTCREVLNDPNLTDLTDCKSANDLDAPAEGLWWGAVITNQSKKIRTFALNATKIQLIDTKAAEAWLTESGLVPVSAKDLYTALMIDPNKAAYHRGMEFIPTRSRTEDPNDLFRVVESADHRLLSLEQERLP